MILALPGPATATGEDVVELHCHGGRAIVDAIERALARLPGCRRAEPGEFTRRALRNGRIDLAQAEALGELLRAETEWQRRHALHAAEGGLGRAIDQWRGSLVRQAALIEAALAFEEEEEVAGGASFDRSAIEEVLADMRTMLDQPPVERLHDGIRVVLAGPPNAGKSTLLNAMVGREAAIVTPHAGTTRDRVEVPVQRDGIAYVLIDTAGLRETEDEIEAVGISRAEAAMHAADIVLWLGDEPAPAVGGLTLELHPRCDQAERASTGRRVAVSGFTGEGVPRLWAELRTASARLLPREGEVALNRRQRGLMVDAAEALTAAIDQDDDVLAAEELRSALMMFDRLTGRAGVDAVLDEVFSTFCLGK